MRIRLAMRIRPAALTAALMLAAGCRNSTPSLASAVPDGATAIGAIDLAAPVARYWPEFAAAGKDTVLVRHVLSHTAGLPTLEEPTTLADLYDWPTITARLAAQAPRWEPGTVAGYHAVTYGFLVGEIVRRVTGRSLGEFFAEEVAGPLGADFHIGLSAEHDHRVAPVIAPPSSPTVDRIVATALGGNPNPLIQADDGNTVAWRRAAIPSAGGFGNARSVGAVQSVLTGAGTVRGVRLLSAQGCARAWETQYHGEDRVLGGSMRYGMGYGLYGSSCGWGGWGGSLVMVDLDTGLTVSYVMNQMLDQGWLGDERALGIVMAAYDGLARQVAGHPAPSDSLSAHRHDGKSSQVPEARWNDAGHRSAADE